MISEGSCDTEDWSNDVENSALHHGYKLHFKIYSNKSYFKLVLTISQYYCFYCFFFNVTLVSIRVLYKIIKKNHQTLNVFCITGMT